MNVLDAIKAYCYEANHPAPSALFGATDPSTLQLIHLFYAVGRDLRARFNHPLLKRKYSFTTTSGQSEYEVPGDFHRLINTTAFDVTGGWKLDGPRTDSDIVRRNYANIANGVNYSYRFLGAIDQASANTEFDTNGGYIEISPAPSETRTLSFEYISKNFLMPQQWVTGQAVTSGNLRSANNKVYKATTTGTTGATRPSHSSGTASDGTVTWRRWRGAYETILADSDIVLIDQDVLIAGLRYQFRRSKGHDATEEEKLFNSAVAASMSRYDGERVVNADGDDLGQFPNLDEAYVSTGW